MWISKLFYLLLLGIVYLFFCLYLPNFSAYLLIGMLILPIGFFAAAHFGGTKLETTLLLSEEKTVPLEPITCVVQLKNPTFLPIATVALVLAAENITLTERDERKLQAAVAPHETIQLEIPIMPRHCGKIRISLTAIRVYDGIRLFSHKKREKPEITLLTLPKAPMPPKYDTFAPKSKEIPMRPTSEPEEFLGVREYRSGDRLRAIHWKLSSHFSKPMVREYGTPVRAPVTIGFFYALSPNISDCGSRLDAMLETLLTLTAALCQDSTITVTVIFCSVSDRHTVSADNPEKILSALDSLLRQPPANETTDCLSLSEKTFSFCIADTMPNPSAAEICFVAANPSAGQIPITSGNSAKAVREALRQSFGGAP